MDFKTNEEKDRLEFFYLTDNFKNIIRNNISTESEHKMGFTFIGIRTNISGKYKLHMYIILVPFVENENTVPYQMVSSNFYITDICLSVDNSFYSWVYTEMRNQNSIVIMSFEDNIFKVFNGNCDLILRINKDCNEKKDWMDLEFDDWYKNHTFNNIFSITITNPYLYIVPFPVNPIMVKTQRLKHNYCVCELDKL